MIHIVGIGPGNLELMTLEALNIVDKAETLIGGKRQLEAFEYKQKKSLYLDKGFDFIVEYIDANIDTENIVVLVSGDPCYFSLYRYLSKKLNRKLPIISGLNSLQYFYSKLSLTYEEGRFLSLHGRKMNYIDVILQNPSIGLLTDNEYTPQKIASELFELKLEVQMHVGYRLSYEDEVIYSGSPKEIMNIDKSGMAVVIIENPNFKAQKLHLRDEDFQRNKTPMTKEEIRYITLGKLELQSNNHLIDIGSGTGSISIEASQFLHKGKVTSIERSEDAVEIMKENIKKHQRSNIKVIKGNAEDIVDSVESFDRVFIGGSGRSIGDILDKIENNIAKDGIIVANFITLDTLQQAMNYLEKKEWTYELIQVHISKNQSLGSYQMLKAQNPIFILKIRMNNLK